MKSDRNHEGYHDLTAEKAIRKVEKQRRKKKRNSRLSYRIGERSKIYIS